MKRFLSRSLLAVIYLALILVAGYTGYYFWYEDQAYGIMYDDSLGQRLGPADADRTLVAVIDYRCPHCRFLAPVLDAITEDYPNLKIVLKYIPITEESEPGFRMALAAAQLGKFREAHDFLIDRAQPLDEEAIDMFAEQAGLDKEELNKIMYTEGTTDAMKRVYRAALRLGMTSTPGFVYEDKVYTQYNRRPTLEDFELLLGEPEL